MVVRNTIRSQSNLASKNLTLVDLLQQRSQNQSDRPAYIFLQNGETESNRLTYGELDRKAKAIGAQLQDYRGERALLLYPSGLEFISAFFGCMYAGVIAVPVYPPRRNQKLSRLLAIANDARGRLALTTTSILADVEKRWSSELEAGLELLATDAIEANSTEFVPQSVTPNDLAFLQYTSGSTGTPKGVMVTHGNLIHNQQLIHRAFGHSKHSVGVGWLPLFHDMGLIGHVVQPLYVGFPSVLMPPEAFLMKPTRWLKAISKYKATTSGGPNFAYDLCFEKIKPEQLADFDLSSWDLAYTGAEPVRGKTLGQFNSKFVRCGFNSNAFYPCYGMAETTLFTTGGNKNHVSVIQIDAAQLKQNAIADRISGASRVFVGVGHSHSDTKVVIVDPDSLTPCKSERVGEIWVKGDSVASGYWNRPQATQETFQARLKDTGEYPFLRTGDLGFLSNGELFVTGRLKDLIIIRGRNYYPQDIELTVENSHPALRNYCSAAFSIELAGKEHLTIACEVERTYLRKLNVDEVVNAIKIAVSTEHQLEAEQIVLLKTGTILKTSSGKIRRRACKLELLLDRLNVVGQWVKRNVRASTLNSQQDALPHDSPTRAAISAWLTAKIAELAAIAPETIDPKQPLAVYGLDSLQALTLAGELETWLGIPIAPTVTYNYPTIEELADYLGQTSTAISAIVPPIPTTLESNPPLSFEQERLWTVTQFIGHGAVHNITQAIRLTGQLNVGVLQNCLNEIIRRHEALRTNFTIVEGSPVQTIRPNLTITLKSIALEISNRDCQLDFIQEFIEKEAQKPFDLEREALFDFQLVRLEESDLILVLRMHHMIADAISLNILVRELAALYEASIKGKVSPLPELKLQYKDVAVWQRQYLQGEILESGLTYWRRQLNGVVPLKLPLDRPRPLVSSFRGGHQYFQLSADVWSAIKQLSLRYGVTPYVTLLTAFDILLYHCCQQTDIVVGSPMSGRLQPQTQSMIGFFARPILLRQDLSGNPAFEELLLKVRSVVLAASDRQHLPLSKIVEAIEVQHDPENPQLLSVLFSFLGQHSGSIDLPNLTLTPIWSATKTPTDVDLFLTLSQVDGQLKGVFEYNSDLFEENTIILLIDAYSSILEQCLESPQKQLTQFSLYSQLTAINSPRGKNQNVATAIAPQVAITANFTAEPIADALNFWLQKLDLNWQLEFAPYNQVFQQLLATDSLLAQNQQGINVVLLRWEDWVKFDSTEISWDNFILQIEQNTQRAIAALKTAADIATPYLVCLCPASPQIVADKKRAALLHTQEQKLVRELSDVNGIYLVTTKELTSTYPVESFYDPHGDKLARIPFTPLFFTALGTTIARKIHSLYQPTYKAIVFDCDRTLWQGICGEDGARGIAVTPPYQALQRFAIAQQEQGMLLCLCSKNNLEDVLQVFEQNQDLLLNREHLASWRINWRGKSENLKSLAKQLQLGLDSFIFIDDNPIECAEVRANCPEVLTLQLPEPDDIPRFLQHIWAFDRLKVTQEDRDRASYYRQNLQRQQLSQQSLTLKDFIESLDLEVTIVPMTGKQISRVSQLSQRTNQFNSTTIRRSARELEDLWRSGKLNFLTVKVRDRFGEYGLVGAIAFAVREQILEVDALMLSCRVLGKGVEHQVLAELGSIAIKSQLNSVVVNYKPSTKNQPVLDFLNRVGSQHRQNWKGEQFVLPSNYCRAIAYNPQSTELTTERSSQSPEIEIVPSQSALIEGIAKQLYDARSIERAMSLGDRTSTKDNLQPETRLDFTPVTDTQQQLAALWLEILGLTIVSIKDNFFNIGGNSLLAVRLMSRIRETFAVDLSLSELLNAPTIESLGRSIETIGRGEASIETSSFLDLDAEAVLDPAITPSNQQPKQLSQAKAIFLTGATGFLGAFLLRELLQQTNAQVYCLVRSANPQKGQQKIQQNLERYQIWQEDFRQRIVPIVGDLSLPLLGLTEEEFQQQARSLDIIYHNGALVNLTYPYSEHKAANVLGTQEVLRLATQTKVKPVNFVSTVAVFDSEDYLKKQPKVILETQDLPDSSSVHGGYSQSKWVAEKLVRIAGDRGVPIRIYRPGVVTGDSQTGTWNTDDANCRILRGIVRLGKRPNLESIVEMGPVDYVSKALVCLSKQEQSIGRVFHLVNPQPISSSNLAEWIDNYGYQIQLIDYSQWQQESLNLSNVDDSNPLAALTPLFFEKVPGGKTLFEAKSKRPIFDCQNTLAGLANKNIVCPSVKDLLNVYFSYLVEQDFLPKPVPKTDR